MDGKYNMERLTNKDRVLLDIAYETIKMKDLEKLMNEADTELAKRIIASYMRMYKNFLK